MAIELLKRRSVPSSMIRRAIIAGIVLFAISSFDRATAQITNGSFELNTPYAVNQFLLIGNPTTIPGWILNSSYGTCIFNIVQDGQATQGENYLSLSTMSQEYWDGKFTLSADSNFYVPPDYSVSFDYLFSAGGEGGSGYASMRLGNIYQVFSTTPNWKHVSFNVPSGTTSLQFEVGANSGRNGYGSAEFNIDNVQVVPEPCSFALLAFGLGGLPIVLWQRWSDKKNIKR
jgi:hypothetical protein